MNRQFSCFTLSLLACLLAASTVGAQVEISAVPSANNPAVGYQIEVSINIAGGSNVAGYDFRLTFNSTELEFISIENSNYLPGDPFSRRCRLPPRRHVCTRNRTWERFSEICRSHADGDS